LIVFTLPSVTNQTKGKASAKRQNNAPIASRGEIFLIEFMLDPSKVRRKRKSSAGFVHSFGPGYSSTGW
jgi:hypothetical protein